MFGSMHGSEDARSYAHNVIRVLTICSIERILIVNVVEIKAERNINMPKEST